MRGVAGLPDINIENIWAYMKRQLGSMVVTWENLDTTIMDIWNNIPDYIIQNLHRSLPKRLRDCYKSKGYITKY